VRVRGCEETAIAAYCVTGGMDRECPIGFLGQEFVKDAEKYNGRLVQSG
jgi:hypothetical protein